MAKSMGTHTQNLCSAINPSKVHTHSSEHTHTVNTHPEQRAVPGSIRGFGALLKGSSVVVLRVERLLYINQPPPIPAGPRLELTTFGLRGRLSNY